MKRLLTGAEAVAWGAALAGARLLALPSAQPVSDLVRAAQRAPPIERALGDAEAVEACLRACAGGSRAVAVVSMLPAVESVIRAAAASGRARGGLVIVACDDPGLGFGGAVRDSRPLARALGLPCLEPSDAQECLQHVGAALALSESLGAPAVLRLTARVATTARPVDPSGAQGAASRHYPDAVTASGFHRLELRERSLGVVTAGSAYHHLREALPQASILKLGLAHPLPRALVDRLVGEVDAVVVVEEGEPAIERELRAMGVACRGQDLLPRGGELSPDLLARTLGMRAVRPPPPDAEELPARPAEASAGCPHRALQQALKRLQVSAVGDPGCAFPGARPTAAEDAPGECAEEEVSGEAALARERVRGRRVMLLSAGDLAGEAAALAAATRAGAGAIVVLDVSPYARGERMRREVDVFDVAACASAIAEALERSGVGLVVARGGCPLTAEQPGVAQAVLERRCNRCGACLRLGCPAIAEGEEAMTIDAGACAGCGLCRQVCRAGAIVAGPVAGPEDAPP